MVNVVVANSLLCVLDAGHVPDDYQGPLRLHELDHELRLRLRAPWERLLRVSHLPCSLVGPVLEDVPVVEGPDQADSGVELDVASPGVELPSPGCSGSVRLRQYRLWQRKPWLRRVGRVG